MTNNEWFAGLGPLERLYRDPDVTAIMVDAPALVRVERLGRLEDAPVAFASAEEVAALVERLAGRYPAGSPSVEARLPDGAQLTAILPPVAVNGPCLIISKLIRQQITWDTLIGWGALSAEAAALLQAAVADHANILLAGGPASGKTTLLNLLAGSIGPAERVIAVEARHELTFDHPRAIFLEVGDPAASLPDPGPQRIADLQGALQSHQHPPIERLQAAFVDASHRFTAVLHAAVRLRPEWLVINELHGGEAMTALRVISLGHSGIASLHATSSADALGRLEAMCLMANLGLGLAEIRALIAQAFKLVVVQLRQPDGRRRVVEISEVAGLERERLVVRPLMRYNPDTDRLEASGAAA